MEIAVNYAEAAMSTLFYNAGRGERFASTSVQAGKQTQLSGFFDILIHVAFGVISSCLKFQPNAQKPASTHSDFSFVPITR